MIIDLIENDGCREEKAFFFPCSKIIDEVVYIFEELSRKAELIWDNDANIAGMAWNIRGRNIPIVQYSRGFTIPKNTAIIVLSHEKEIIEMLADRGDYEELPIYVYRRAHISGLRKERKVRREQLVVNNINKRMYHLVKAKRGMTEEYISSVQKASLDKVIYPCVQLVVTTGCTLNCRECFAAKPFLNKYECFQYDDLEQDVENFLECIDGCIELELIGGEFFTHPEAGRIIELLRDSHKIEMLVITTNGTVIPYQETIRAMNHNKVFVALSEYKVVDFHRTEQVLDEEGIQWYPINSGWIPMPKYDARKGLFESYGLDVTGLEKAYHKCSNLKMCYTIVNHRLYICYRTAMLAKVGKHKFNKREYVDLQLPYDIRKSEIEQLLYVGFTEGCNYCGMGDPAEQHIWVEPAEQLSKSKA